MQLSISEILELTGGKLIQGEETEQISGVSSLDEADASEISFLGNEKYFADFLATNAAAVFVPAGLPKVPENVALIEVENPSFAFAAVVKALAIRLRKFTPGIHPRAYVADGVKLDPDKVSVKAGAVVEAGCEIGDGSEIGSNAVIYEGSKLGENCLVYANVTVREYCQIGNRVILQPGCVIGSDGYGYELVDGKHSKVDQVGIVILEDDVEVGANTAIDRARFGKTVIGEGTKIDNLVQIAHNVSTEKHCLIVSQTGIAGSTHLGNYVTVAAQVGIAGHLKIGDKAILLARSGVTKTLEGGQMYAGFPARQARKDQIKLAALSKLPNLIKNVRDQQSRLETLESQAQK